MISQLPRLSDYDISPHHGFLPEQVPLSILPDTYYEPWETIVRNFQSLILTKRLRQIVDALPTLSTDLLLTEAEWRRAYSVLGFIAHAYIWGGDSPADIVPPSISIPFLSTCQHLELPSVATYAGVVLWNWRPLFTSEPIDSLNNLSTLMTFTGSLDESWFYLVSVAMEAKAGPTIPLMIEAIAAARHNDSKTVTQCLQTFAETLDELGTILEQMYENCDPHVFYHRIRPFLAGGKNMGAAGLPNGVKFDDGSGNAPYVQYSGGSNAQSSAIQFFDIVLGVEHRPTGEKRTDAASDSEGSVQPPAHNFILEMRKYMPGPHRRFLEHVEGVANIREYVAKNRNNRALVTAFDAALAMLRALRDKHLRMVSRYIIVKSRESSSSSRASASAAASAANAQRINIANTLSRVDSKKLRGTGGTALIAFLKQARDETGEPAIDAWARRLLNNGPADLREGVYGVGKEDGPVGGGGGGVARLGKMSEHLDGEVEIVGLAGTWSVDDSEGGVSYSFIFVFFVWLFVCEEHVLTGVADLPLVGRMFGRCLRWTEYGVWSLEYGGFFDCARR
ncbi:indoleamine 2,3-dioxygenase family protein [Westerdykella ornata]|uniref:Indoleamine 2,3-dioxygenase n=1 Tax=Westerdykella ornata TaxID=318751 RepID=A0A6A6J842_WESOR|nr:indoleamine 2,3-dioxygenase family protein [Westerdykella ornata]KAF2272535.1 indoleamine 2,3-dioxygenase family protein [Westerdykella ornata]